MIAAFFVFVFGACIGSFLSVVLHRTKAGETFCRGRSRCPRCLHNLSAADLVPIVSWLIRRGKCRYCHAVISWQYPLLEIGLGTSFFLAYWVRRSDFAAFEWQAFADLFFVFIIIAFFALIFVYDARHGEVPDSFSLGAIAAGFLYAIVLKPEFIWQYGLAALLGAAFFAAQYYLSGKKWVGSGDILIGTAMGATLGFGGLAAALFFAYDLGLVAAVYLMIAKRKTMQSTIPLGPFLSLGAVIVIIMRLGGKIFGFYA